MFKSEEDFIEQLIQPVSVAVMRMDMIDESGTEPVVILSKEEFEALKRSIDQIKMLATGRRDQVVENARRRHGVD